MNPLQTYHDLDNKFFLEIFENIPVGIGVFKIENLNNLKSIRYVYMNKVILNYMQKKKEDVIGKTIFDVTPEAYSIESGRQVIQTYLEVAKTQKSIDLGRVSYENNSSSGIYECSIHPLSDSYVYVKLNNITELVKTQLELIENHKMATLGTLISGLAHEVNNPLNYISGSLDVINKDLDSVIFDIKKIQKHLRYAKLGTSKISAIIKKLQILNKDSSETIEDCNLNEIIENSLSINCNRTKSKVQIIKEFTKEKILVRANKTNLHTAFLNIINNALDAMEASKRQGILRIKTTIKNQFYEVEINDNGCGISDEHMDKIKNPFFTTKDPGKGVGLGLSLANNSIKSLNGSLDIKSKIGHGSTFTVKFPLNNIRLAS